MIGRGEWRFLGLVLSGVLALASGCGSGSTGPAAATIATITEPGSFPVGRVTLQIVDESRPTKATGDSSGSDARLLVTDVYYPAATGNAGEVYPDAAPATSGGPFPLIVMAHGLFGERTNFTGTLELLASQGYVVAAPDFPLTNFSTFASKTVWLPDLFEQPGDVSFVIDSLTGRAANPLAAGGSISGDLVGVVDGSRIGLIGHSYGGATALLTGFDGPLVDPRIDAVVALSPFSCFFGSESFVGDSVPVLLVHGSSDAILEQVWSDELDEFLPAPQIYARIVGGDHMGFVSDPNRPDGERDLEFSSVVSSAEEAAIDSLAEFGGGAAVSVPGVDLVRCTLRPLIAPPGLELDPVIPMKRQRAMTDAAMILFLDTYVKGGVDSTTSLNQKLAELAPEMIVTVK